MSIYYKAFFDGKLIEETIAVFTVHDQARKSNWRNGTFVHGSSSHESTWYRKTNGTMYLTHPDHVPKQYQAMVLLLE